MVRICKTFLKISGSVFAAGIVLLIVGFCTGGHWRDMQVPSHYNPFSNPRLGIDSQAGPTAIGTSSSDFSVTGDITALDFDFGCGDVTIAIGDAFSLTASDDARVEQSFENGTLKLSYKSKRWLTHVPTFIITLPKATYDHVEFDVGVSSFKADGISCKFADISVGVAQMTLTNFTASEGSELDVGTGQLNLDGTLTGIVSADVGLGQINMNLTTPPDYGYDVDVGMGSVNIGNSAFNGIGNKGSLNPGAKNFYDLSCGLGNLTVNFT